MDYFNFVTEVLVNADDISESMQQTSVLQVLTAKIKAMDTWLLRIPSWAFIGMIFLHFPLQNVTSIAFSW